MLLLLRLICRLLVLLARVVVPAAQVEPFPRPVPPITKPQWLAADVAEGERQLSRGRLGAVEPLRAIPEPLSGR